MSTMSRAALTLALAVGATAAKNSVAATSGPDTLTVGILGDYGWTGWQPLPLSFCNDVVPKLIANGVTIPGEIQNDCDPGDRYDIRNATIEQKATAKYIESVCLQKNCSAFISVGDNFYDSGVNFDTEGILRFEEAWVNMYQGPAFDNKTWYQCLGNHDVVLGEPAVDFETRIASLVDDRWYFGTQNKPYYTYDLTGSNWTATFVVVDSDCFINAYQSPTSVYYNSYIQACHKTTSQQVDFLKQAFAKSTADWKFLQLHHGFISSSSNYTELTPLIDIVQQHNGIVVNGHDHCMAHYEYEGTSFVLTGAAGYSQAGDCNYGKKLGPFAKWLGADKLQAANGFVTADISYDAVTFEYYARDMRFSGSDLYPVKHDMKPSYNFTVTKHST